jgi:hypothetical protein
MPNPFEGDILYRMAQAKDFTAMKVLSNIPISTDEYWELVARATCKKAQEDEYLGPCCADDDPKVNPWKENGVPVFGAFPPQVLKLKR